MEKVKLGDIGQVITGNTPSKKNKEFYNSKDINFFKPSDIDENKINLLINSEEYISNIARDKARILPEGTVLVTCIGSIGKVGILTKESTCNQQINAIIPNERIDGKYLAYLIYNKKEYMQKKANAPVVPIINKTDFSNIEITICDKLKQIEIVNKLDKVQEIIDIRKKQIKQLDELIKSQFSQRFENDKCPNYKWKEVFNTTTGKLDSNAMVEGGNYPFFTCAKESFWIDKYAFDCEALLLAGNNAAGIYDVKYYKGKFNAYQRTYVLTLKNHEWSYQLFKLQLEEKLELLRHQSKGTNTRYLTMTILNDLEFKIPSVEEQNKFAEFVKQIDKQKFEIQKSLEEIQKLQESLMNKYFG